MNSINLGQLGSLDWRVAAQPVPAAGRSSGACSADIHALVGKHPFFRCSHRLGHGPVKP